MGNVRPPATKDPVANSVHFDALRGFAALLVMAGHARVLFVRSLTGGAVLHTSARIPGSLGSMAASNPAANGNSIGHEAVMVFFVLSGLLVGGSAIRLLRREQWSWKDYLVKRLTRLWVVLIPALVLGFLLDSAGMHVFTNPHSIYSGPAGQTLVAADLPSRYSPAIVLGNVAFLQNILVPCAGTNVALWSLSNEFWYYLAFPLLLLGLFGNGRRWKRAIFLTVFAAIMFGIGSHASRLFLVWSLGAVITVLPRKVPAPLAKWGAAICAVILAVALIWVKKHVLNLVVAEFTIALICGLLLYLLLPQTQRLSRGVYSYISTFTSKISYTLYLVHVPILIFLCACLNNPWRLRPSTLANDLIIVAISAVTVVLAYGFYLLFEANTDHVRRFILQYLRNAPVPVQKNIAVPVLPAGARVAAGGR